MDGLVVGVLNHPADTKGGGEATGSLWGRLSGLHGEGRGPSSQNEVRGRFVSTVGDGHGDKSMPPVVEPGRAVERRQKSRWPARPGASTCAFWRPALCW